MSEKSTLDKLYFQRLFYLYIIVPAICAALQLCIRRVAGVDIIAHFPAAISTTSISVFISFIFPWDKLIVRANLGVFLMFLTDLALYIVIIGDSVKTEEEALNVELMQILCGTCFLASLAGVVMIRFNEVREQRKATIETTEQKQP